MVTRARKCAREAKARAQASGRAKAAGTAPARSKLRFDQQLRSRQLQGGRDARERVERDHALPSFDFADIGQAETRLEGELLLGELTGQAFCTHSGTEFPLELGGTVGHTKR